MPIIKCPKCGEKYDSMYSFHSCKRPKEKEQRESGREKRFFMEDMWDILKIIFALIIIGVLVWNFLAIFDIVEPPGGYVEEKELYETDQSVKCFMGICW